MDGGIDVQNEAKDQVETEECLTAADKSDHTKECGPPQTRLWKLKVFAIYCMLIGLGLSSALNGPTMVDMEEWLDTGTAGMSIALTLAGVGYMVGSALCSVVYDRFRHEFKLLLSNFALGSFLALAPWPRQLVAFSVFFMLKGVAMGLMVSCAQGYLISLMEGHRLKNPANQLFHVSYSVGASTGPLIVKPFLRPDIHGQGIIANASKGSNASAVVPNTTVKSSFEYLSNTTSDELEEIYSLRVPYAFLTIGLTILILTIPIGVAYFLGPLSIRVDRKRSMRNVKKMRRQSEPKKYHAIILTFVFFWYYFYLWVEDMPGSYLAAFVIKHLGWARHAGPLITTTLWGGHSLARILAVPISLFATPRQMIISTMTLTAVAYVLMLALMRVHPAAVWLSVGLAGFGVASSFGTMVCWTSQHLHLQGTASAVIFTGVSFGGMTAPLIAGFLFEKVSPIYAIYLMLIGILSQIFIYALLEIYMRCSKVRNAFNADN